MSEVDLIEKAVSERAWYPLAACVLTLVITLWRKAQPLVWERIPDRWQWVPATVLAGAGAFVDAEVSGKALVTALCLTFYSLFAGAMTAIGIAHTAKRIGAKPPTGPTIVAIVLFCASGCSSLPRPRAVSDVAHDLCESVLVGRAEVVQKAKQQGLSPLEVARALCLTNEVVRPFLSSADSAGDEAIGSAQNAGLLPKP